LSAGTYLARNQTDIDVYGLTKSDAAIAQIHCPLFIILGSEEPHIGVTEDLERVRAKATRSSDVTTRIFDGADHSYSGHESEVGQAIAAWADRL
jgi:dienelactone hydrolase